MPLAHFMVYFSLVFNPVKSFDEKGGLFSVLKHFAPAKRAPIANSTTKYVGMSGLTESVAQSHFVLLKDM